MDATSLLATLQSAVPEATLEPAPSLDLQTTFYVPREQLMPIAVALRSREDLAFTCLAEVTAVDFWPREPRYEVVYQLVSIAHRFRVRMKVRLHADGANVPTMTTLWPAANWLEREVWDLFGIAFDGHPDPRRLLMPDDWDGFPLRKDYPVQIRMTPGAAEPLQVTEEEFRANLARDRLTRR